MTHKLWNLPRWGGTVICLLAVSSMVEAQEAAAPGSDANDRMAQQEQRIQELEEFEAEAIRGGPDAVSRGDDSPSAEESGATANRLEGITGDVRETHQLFTSGELASDEFPASWPMFGTDMRMKIGGYIKTDFVADFDGTLDPTQFLMRTIPVAGTPEFGADSYVDFFARETRFNLDIRRKIPGSWTFPTRGC